MERLPGTVRDNLAKLAIRLLGKVPSQTDTREALYESACRRYLDRLHPRQQKAVVNRLIRFLPGPELTSLFVATLQRNYRAMVWLLENGASANDDVPQTLWTPLHLAASQEDMPAVVLLIYFNADPTRRAHRHGWDINNEAYWVRHDANNDEKYKFSSVIKFEANDMIPPSEMAQGERLSRALHQEERRWYRKEEEEEEGDEGGEDMVKDDDDVNDVDGDDETSWTGTSCTDCQSKKDGPRPMCTGKVLILHRNTRKCASKNE